MTMAPESVRELEEILRGNGVTLTPVNPPLEEGPELETADGRFRVQPARVMNRREQLVTLYKTDTAEAVPTDVNEAVKRMRKRFPSTGFFAQANPQLAGRYAFTLGNWNAETQRYEAPFEEDKSGLLCMLNRKSEDFAYTRELGIKSVCPLHRIPNILQLEAHMKSKHTDAWGMIQITRDRLEASQDRTRMTQLLELVLKAQGIDVAKAPAIATEVMEAQASPPPADPGEVVDPNAVQVQCQDCGQVFKGKNKGGVSNALAVHRKKVH